MIFNTKLHFRKKVQMWVITINYNTNQYRIIYLKLNDV